MIRLSKLMSEKGLCSRREADELIREGLVQVDGEIVSTLGVKVSPDADIELLSRGRQRMQQKVSIALHKPIGYVSNLPEKGYEPAIRLITHENQDPRFKDQKQFRYSMTKGLAVAGRLDIDSSGLLIFTQEGTLAKKIIGESSQVEKEYIVRVQGQICDNGLELLQHGLEIDGVPLKKAKVKWVIPNKKLKFVLKEGKKRQIRKMCEQVGLKVTGLQRIRIGHIKLGALKEGQWRFIRSEDV